MGKAPLVCDAAQQGREEEEPRRERAARTRRAVSRWCDVISRQAKGDKGAGAARPRLGLQLVKSVRCVQGLLGTRAAGSPEPWKGLAQCS